MISSFWLLVVVALLFGVAGIDRILAEDWPFALFYLGLTVVNGAVAWMEYLK